MRWHPETSRDGSIDEETLKPNLLHIEIWFRRGPIKAPLPPESEISAINEFSANDGPYDQRFLESICSRAFERRLAQY